MKKLHNFSYVFIFAMLLIKVIAFRVLIFDTRSIAHIIFVEFPMWALILALLLVVVKKRIWLAIGIYNFIVSAIFFAVTLYVRYYSTIPSYYDLQQTAQSASVGHTIALLANPYDFLFFLDLLILIVLAKRWEVPKKNSLLKYASTGIAAMCLISTAYAFRQPIIDVSFFAKENGYIQSQLVQMYQRANETAHASSTELSAKELEELKGNEYVPVNSHAAFGLAEGRHLFMIQVESLQNFTIGRSIGEQEITPNLNELIKENAYFSNVFQQIGAGTTSDAEWIANTGLYPEGMVPIVNSLNGKEAPSLSTILKKEGYGSATYHADDISFWNRNVLYPVLGYQEVYSSEEIPEKEEVGYGPSDEVLFDFVLEKLSGQLEKHERFYSNIVTLTSHTPFILPEEMQYLDLPESYVDAYTGNYLQSIRYADEQIGDFIGALKREGIYDESLIVLFGDHSGLHGSPVTPEDERLLEEFIGHPYTMKDRFTIPLIMAGGNLFEAQEMTRLGGQVDIMPTILALLGIDAETPMMGHNLFEYKKNLLGMRYYMPGGSFIQSEQLYKAPGAKLPDTMYDMKTMDERAKNSATKKHKKNTQEILKYSDALVKPYIEK